jgi:hypothetical protein
MLFHSQELLIQFSSPMQTISKLHREVLEEITGHAVALLVEAYDTKRKVAGSIPHEVIGFFNWPNPSSRTMAMESTQPLAEMSTRNLPGGKGRPARKADNLAVICEPIV